MSTAPKPNTAAATPKPAVLPRVGRTVHYRSKIQSRMGSGIIPDHVAAIITRAHDENTVDLNVFRVGEHGSLCIEKATLRGYKLDAVDEWWPANG